MSRKLNLTIRTATRDRQANIDAPDDSTASELIGSAQENWNLPTDYEYVIRCERTGTQLVADQTLDAQGIQPGDILELQPLADAG